MNFAKIYLSVCFFPHASSMELRSPFNLQISSSPRLKTIFLCMLGHVRLFATPWTVAHQSPLSRLHCPCNFPGKNTWIGCHFLLQIFLNCLFIFSPSFWNVYHLLLFIFLQGTLCMSSSRPLDGLQWPSLLTIHLVKFFISEIRS